MVHLYAHYIIIYLKRKAELFKPISAYMNIGILEEYSKAKWGEFSTFEVKEKLIKI